MRYAEWDAAYVLGALSAQDRHAYEAHLDTCPECARAIAELAPAAALLSRLSAQDVARLDEVGEDAAARSGFVSLARERARRTRRVRWAAAAAAVVLIVAAIAVPVSIAALNRPTAGFALESVTDVPIEASVRLTSVAWGTRVDLDCRYPDVYVPGAPPVPEAGWTYALTLVGADGAESTVSTWRSWPGASARLSGATALSVDEIASVELRSAKGTILMRYDLGGG
ncbi:zf-HC2 domain-containing protein [Microbacterium ulmi]|uniref:Zf-HC2 domain-containing protein n=1 Tax=Microbacterium ulmi TaxID=179095 RepID=A0A7Y2M2R1_9MICO|nr:zf-HC2 domain-containing protein [Microbacterium ulmi]NII68177.1 hypothetical protein [Microbacterium ulmi]NNH05369.1 zf-HC2 domain-containing protein [Microbacterium ulmi]